MKFNQEGVKYKPITIKFEKKREAEAFFSLIAKIDSKNDNSAVTITQEELKIAQTISNAVTNMEIII